MVTRRCEIAVMAEAGMARAGIAKSSSTEVLAETIHEKVLVLTGISFEKK